MEGNIAFKAFLYSDKIDSPSEVRWFYVEQNAIVSLENVKEKLQATFPCLNENNYSLSWKDCDNDLISISSDAELLIALSNIRTDPRRLYVRLESELMDTPSQSNLACEQSGVSFQGPPTQNSTGQQNPPNSTPPNSTVDAPLHPGVLCDGCEGPVRGFRYKCLECPDYDLCPQCEAGRGHPQHCFIRIVDPEASFRLRKGLSHQFGKKLFKHCDREQTREKSEGARKYHKRHGHQRHGWFETLSKYMNDVNMAMASENENETNNTNESNAKNNSSENKTRGNGESSNTKGGCPYFNMGAPPQKQSSNDKGDGNNSDDIHVNYLKNIGQTIANLLDPLGIDVDIDVRTRNSTQNMETENITSNTTKESPKGAPKPNLTNNNKSEINITTSENKTETDNSDISKRAVPVFSNSSDSVYTSCSMNSGAPVVSSFVNKGTPMETENGWTLLDDVNEISKSENEMGSGTSGNDSEGNNATNTNSTHNTNGNSTQNTNGNNQKQQQAPLFGGFTMGMGPFGAPPAPPMGFPPVPPMGGGTPGQFNFDHMARELQKHIQTHFKGAMDAAQSAAQSATTASQQQTTSNNSTNQNSTQQSQTREQQKTFDNNSTSQQSTQSQNQNNLGNLNPNISNETETKTNSTNGNINKGATPRTGAPVMTQRVYPNLSEQKLDERKVSSDENVIGASAPPQPRHKDSVVAKGLETMISMGFNNEGGWLTTVLECVNGDVTRALDLLQPVKK